jgi:6-phosphogluconolactonase
MTRLAFTLLAVLLAAAPPALPQKASTKGDYLMYIGTYTRGKSQGIYAWRFSPASGNLTPLGLVAETANPSFLAIHPTRPLLYAVGEMYGSGAEGGAVSAFTIDRKSGKLTPLNKVSSQGGGPCHLNVDRTGKSLLVVNYGTGSTAAYRIQQDGSLTEATSVIQHSGSSVNPKRQSGPHAHSVNLSPDNRFAFVADLGLDQVLVYRLDPAKGLLEAHNPPFAKVNPGAGPRHFAFHPSGRFAYVINEIQSTVTAFSYDAKAGVLKEIQTVSTLPAGFSGNNSTAEVQVHPSGRFLYGSNRGHDSIAVFSLDPSKGTLTLLENTPTQGKTPRNFGIDPTGGYLFAANQNTDNIAVYRIDAKTGKLTATGQMLEAGAPVCVKFTAAD